MSQWIVGAGRGDITAFIPGIVMLGYGNPHNTVKYVDTPLTARAFWLESQSEISIMICFEICFVTQSLFDGLWQELSLLYPKLKKEHLLVSAQHTHAAPSGYTHYALYSMPTPGFSQEVLDKLIQGGIAAVQNAYDSKRPGKILYREADVPYDAEVSFNRSLRAYNRNPEVKEKVTAENQQYATERTMKLIELVDDQGPFASWNWFAVHPTNIIWTNHFISPGNKGYASLYLEDYYKRTAHRDYIAVFAQGNTGDVSPVRAPSEWDHWIKKSDESMILKAKENGQKQYKFAKKFLHDITPVEVTGEIDGELIYVDFSHIEIEKDRLPSGVKSASTTPACFGVAFMEGAENAGIADPIKWLTRGLCNIIKAWEYLIMPFRSKDWVSKTKRKYEMQAPKHIFVEAGEKKVLGTSRVMDLIVPGFADPAIAYFKRIHKRGGCHEHTWTQHILPLSILRLGQFSFVGIPGETTTMTGRRIHRELSQILGGTVVLAPYSQAFCGYVTTAEEYEAQCYEGGHTVFGKWTQLAFQQNLARLAREMKLDKKDRVLDKSLKPPVFTQYELSLRRFKDAANLGADPLPS